MKKKKPYRLRENIFKQNNLQRNCYYLNVCVPQNSYVETYPIPNVMTLGGGDFDR